MIKIRPYMKKSPKGNWVAYNMKPTKQNRPYISILASNADFHGMVAALRNRGLL